MGGATSVIPNDMKDQLSEVGHKKLQEFEQKCLRDNLSPVELHLMLTTKYEELLRLDKRNMTPKRSMRMSATTLNLVVSNKENKDQQIAVNQTSEKKIIGRETLFNKDSKVVRPRSGIRRNSFGGSGTSIGVQKFVELREKAKEGYSKPPANLARPKSGIRCKSFTVVTSKELSISSDWNEDPDKRFPLEQLIATSEQLTNRSNEVNINTTNQTDIDKPLDRVANILQVVESCATFYECKLCDRKFPTTNLLDLHIQHSQMHKIAVETAEIKFKAAYEDAERIANLVRVAVFRFKSFGEKNRERTLNSANQTQLRWKRAIRRLINQMLTKQYTRLLDTMQIAPIASPDMILLYNGTQFFWRAKVTFNITIFYHINYGILEIIPQMLPKIISDGETLLKQGLNGIDLDLSPRIYLDFKLVESL
eukprot:gene15094-20311_t